ncbi:hypothetical protein [Ruegeria sp. HKCCA6707]|uniref:hypothetical protein n=1 Tax=Ruegeria sp. HKCCA6707 TaxID=2682996 RepID=UPI001488FF1A|nr:hypothetical protein [Ruegeria sp. HKCCA6707]
MALISHPSNAPWQRMVRMIVKSSENNQKTSMKGSSIASSGSGKQGSSETK